MENSMMARRRSALAKGIFAALLVSVGAAALSPDWARALKAQGYYGNVDLGVTLLPSQTTSIAGDTVDFLVSITNFGPDAANRVRAIAGASNLHVLETSGCAGDPLGYPQCRLASPLLAGASGDYLLHMKIPTSARGNVQLSVAVTSDDDESGPGNEVALFNAPILPLVDLKTSMQCRSSTFPSPSTPLVCDFTIRNDGPSAALGAGVFFYLAGTERGSWTCQSNRPGQCPDGVDLTWVYNFSPPTVEPGDVLHIRGEFPPPNAAAIDLVSVLGGITRHEDEAAANYGDNVVSGSFDTTLLRDGFDPDPASIQR